MINFNEDETTGLLGSVDISPTKGEEYQSRARQLSALISIDQSKGATPFNEMSLYEKKSTLLSRELE